MASQRGQYSKVNYAMVFASFATGLLAGSLGNWAADNLPGWRKTVVFGTTETAKLRKRTLLLYVAMVAACAATAWLVGPDPLRVAIGWLYTTFLLTVLVIDLEHRRVLNIMVGPAVVVVLVLSLLPQTPTLQSALIGGAVGLGLFILVYLLSRGHLGMGDVKLAGLIGLMLGYPAALNALMAGIILGAVAALILLATRRATRKSTMAYAPYLALGALFTMWWYW
jgi:leader peptidase (prepilin peptidase)/N-methyltransferase